MQSPWENSKPIEPKRTEAEAELYQIIYVLKDELDSLKARLDQERSRGGMLEIALGRAEKELNEARGERR